MLSRLLKHLAIAGVCLTAALPAVGQFTYFGPGKNGGVTTNGAFVEFGVYNNQIVWGRRGTHQAAWDHDDQAKWTTVANTSTNKPVAAHFTWVGSTRRIWIAYKDRQTGYVRVGYSDTIATSDSGTFNQIYRFTGNEDKTDAAPAIGQVGSRIYVFWRNPTDKKLRFKFINYSSTLGSDWSITYNLTSSRVPQVDKPLLSAPCAVRIGADLYILAKMDFPSSIWHQKVVYWRLTYNTSANTYDLNWWSTWHPKAFTAPLDNTMWPPTVFWGGHVNGDMGCLLVNDYVQPTQAAMSGKTIKIVADYESHWTNYQRSAPGTPDTTVNYPWHLAISREMLDAVLNTNPTTVIIRTTDASIGGDYIKEFMGDATGGGKYLRFKAFSGDNDDVPDDWTLKNYIQEKKNNPATSGIQWVIEVGNEPNAFIPNSNPRRRWIEDAAVYRSRLIETGYVLPLYTNLCTFIASMPVYSGSDPDFTYPYIKTVLEPIPNTTIKVETYYPGFGVHSYTGDEFFRNNGSLDALFWTLAKTDPTKWIVVSEMGINSTSAWDSKADIFKNYLDILPARVLHSSIFTLDPFDVWHHPLDPNQGPMLYSVDCPYDPFGWGQCYGPNDPMYYTSSQRNQPYADYAFGKKLRDW